MSLLDIHQKLSLSSIPGAALLVLFCIATTSAQSSLFNIPTSDVAPRGTKYIEADLDAHFAKYRDRGWQSYGFSGIYGVGKKSEIGMNAYLVRTGEGFGSVELQLNFKYRVYNSESLGISISAGAIAYIPVSKRFARDSVASVYVVTGKKFKHAWAPRVSGGAYRLIRSRTGEGGTRGFLVGVEQPIHSRINLIADWNTGKNRFGYAAAGIGITLTPSSYLYTAYYFGNTGRGNNSIGIYYGYSF